MSVITNTVKTYDVVSVRESLADVISNIAPTETPLYSNSSKGKASAVYNEWLVDTLQAPDTANAQLEGDDLGTDGYDAATQPTRIGNYMQISRKSAIVDGTTEAVNKAGRKSEMSYQIAKKGAELKRDIEAIALSNQAAVAGGAGTKRKTGSLLAFIKTNVNMGATGANPVWTSSPTATRTDGTLRAADEAFLKDVVQKCWSEGAEPSTVMLGALQKQKFSAFSGIATKYKDVEGTKAATIVGAADIYVSDFGVLTFVPNRFQRNRDAFVLDFEHVRFDTLRNFKTEDMAKTGDAEKKLILVEWGLTVKNEKGLGLIADLS